jgi:glutamate synthase domain-containing protein 2
MVEDSVENREKCICASCPSYPHACQGEVLYCARGASSCDISVKGCSCPLCPVYAENELKSIYYCDKEAVGDTGILMRKRRSDEDAAFYQTVVDIKEMAAAGTSVVRSMGSLKQLPFSLHNLQFIPAQVHRIPLNREEPVSTAVIIGPQAKRPLKVAAPIMISGMSYGATSKKVKLVISRTASLLKIAFNSGEGGILEEELKAAAEYLIGQYATGRFGVDEALLKRVAAIEIRFGQGAYPGKGSYLPASKMTSDVAEVRGLKGGEAADSPAHHHDMTTPAEIKAKVSWLREKTNGVPIGAKIGCGNVEKDLQVLVDAGVDFVALDGFGGGTGATDYCVRENVGIPLVAALPRAARYLTDRGMKDRITLIAGGGLRTSADFARCLALGADAVYTGTAALIAINCEQYRLCHTGLCPTGVTTHNPSLVKQLEVEEGVKRLSNFIRVATAEIAELTRIVGKDDVNGLDREDLVALTRELAEITGTRWVDGDYT